ncbi:MAG: hypothetical protein NVSMB17_13680 [Candidatus Dormibacteria bacterium]
MGVLVVDVGGAATRSARPAIIALATVAPGPSPNSNGTRGAQGDRVPSLPRSGALVAPPLSGLLAALLILATALFFTAFYLGWVYTRGS